MPTNIIKKVFILHIAFCLQIYNFLCKKQNLFAFFYFKNAPALMSSSSICCAISLVNILVIITIDAVF